MRPFSPWLALASFLPLSHGLKAAQVYYVDQPENLAGTVYAMGLDGSSRTALHSAPSSSDFRGIAADPTGRRVFFLFQLYTATSTTTGIRTQISLRALPMEGGETQAIATFPDNSSIADVEWDGGNNWVYFASLATNELKRIRPDGSDLTTVLTHIPVGADFSSRGPYFFGLDLPNQMAYWGIVTDSNQTGTAYSRGSLSGTLDSSFTLTTNTRTRDIAVDSANQRLYWCDRQDGNVYTRAVSGGTTTALRGHRTFNAPHGLALDLEAGKAYLADTGKRGAGAETSSHRVVRFNLDGSGNVEYLSPASSTSEPWDLALDLTSTSYADWKTRFFAAGESLSNPGDDPDGDGLPNAAEYAFLTHPKKPDTTHGLTTPQPGGIRFARRKTTDVPLLVETSTDLVTWHRNGDAPGAVWTQETSVTPRDDDTEWVTVSPAPSLATEPHLWFRLRAVIP